VADQLLAPRPPILRLHLDEHELVVDNFAGGGGASTGIELATGRSPDIAVNHDPEALAMHAANHPGTRHLREDVFDVDPVEVCGGRPVGLAWFSPDCTFHSKARGGKPFRDRRKALRRRGLAWVVTRWARAVHPRVICLENVEEFEDWGPLTAEGVPDPDRAGFTFRRWVAQLERAGYAVEWRQLRACDFGAPTTRKRLYVVARCDGAPIVWPTPTHGPGRAEPYRTAAECIDWSIPVPSIFERERPLAEATLRRIARGIQRYVIDAARPFVVPVAGSAVAPVITEHANASNPRSWRADEPLRTQCANVKGGHFALVAPTLVQTGYGERVGQAPRALDVQAPLGTVVGGGAKHALVTAFLAKHFGGNESPGSSLARSMDTVTARDHHGLVTAQLSLLDRIESPRRDHREEVRALLVKFYGNEREGHSLQLPLGTVTTKDRFGLVTVHGLPYAIVDIGMRMLQPRELFRAQGFPDAYVIDRGEDGAPLTKTAQVRMCGNSVAPPVAAALVAANLAQPARTRRAA
jgi:DNA (cytosine-5)-methyltransferase 1